MTKFKVGDLVEPIDPSQIPVEYKYPQEITSIKGEFIRFNNEKFGYYSHLFRKVDTYTENDILPQTFPPGGLRIGNKKETT